MATASYIGSGNGSGNTGGFLGYSSFGAQSAGSYLVLAAVSNKGLPGSITNVTADGGGSTPAPSLNRFISLGNVNTQFAVYGGLITTSFSSANYTWYASEDNTGVAYIYYVVVPSSGKSLLSPVLNASAYSVSSISLTTNLALNSGDVVFGIGGLSPEKSGGVERDTDTTDGSWSSMGTRLMPSGGFTQSQVFGQFKNVAGGANQTWNPVVTSTNSGTGVASLFTIAELQDQPHWGILA